MFHSLVTLVKLQLSEKLRWKDDASAAHKAGTIAKRIAYMGVAFGIFSALFFVIFAGKELISLNIPPTIHIFTFFIFLLQVVSIITCIVQASQILYTSKDNALLLTYPVKHEFIFISKIICMYILELLRSLTLIFPLFMAYGFIVEGMLTANYIISAVLYSIFLPLIPVMLGSIISIAFVYLTKILKQAGWIKGIFSLILFGLLIFVTIAIVRFVQANSPLQLQEMSLKYNDAVNEFLETKVNKFALYANWIGKGMYNEDGLAWKYHLFMLATIVGVAAISVLISMPTFYKLASASSENAVQKRHKAVNVAHKSTFITFLRKELTLSVRNLGNLASDYVFLFAMPFVLIILSAFIVNIPRSEFGVSLTYGTIGLISLIMLCGSNTASATAISSEGSEFALLKTAPGKTSNIIWSKLLVNLVISFAATFISYAILFIVMAPDIKKGLLDPGKLILVFVFVNLIEIGLLLWSIQLDIVSPKLREFANSQNKAEITNSSQSIIIGLFFSVLFAGILIILFITTLPLYIIAILLILIGLVFVGLRFYFLIQYRNAFFEDIQL